MPVPLRVKGGPLRVLHLSDFHLSPVVSLAFIAESIALGLAEKPDLILVTGDFLTGRLENIAPYAATLARLPAAAPTFACLGNHDGGIWAGSRSGLASIVEVSRLLRRAGIPCLVNTHAEITLREQALQLIGLGDLWSGMCEPAKAFAQIPARGDALRLVLNHNPDAKAQLRPYDWDLMLAGHTHGGQIRIPLLGAPFAPVEDKRYIEGLHRWENRWLYITRGVGNLHGVRFNCRPEVSLLLIG